MKCSIYLLQSAVQKKQEQQLLQNKRVTRIELATQPWEGCVLPLNYTRIN